MINSVLGNDVSAINLFTFCNVNTQQNWWLNKETKIANEYLDQI